MRCIIGCLLFLPFMVFTAFSDVLYVAVIVLELLYFMVSAKRIKGPELDLGLLAVAGGLLLYMIGRLICGDGLGFERILQYALFLLTLISFSRYQWDSEGVGRLFVAFALLMIACLLYWFVSGRVTNYYQAFYGHANGFAVVVIAAVSVTLIDSKGCLRPRHWFVLLISAVLLAFTNSRSAILTVGTLIIVTLWLCMRKGRDSRKKAHIVFALVVVAAFAFSVVYPSLPGTNLGHQLQMLSREYLNKNFFSGREVVWKAVLEALSGSELVGLGLQMTPSMIYDTGFSCHNMYLQTVLQSGIVGLVLLLLLFWVVLSRLCDGGGFECCVGAALLVAMMVHETLEVCLTQNNFSYGLYIWAILGICLAIGRYGKRDAIGDGSTDEDATFSRKRSSTVFSPDL